MQILFFLFLLAAVLILILVNRNSIRSCHEDIDEIRTSIYELRRNARARQAEMNRDLAGIRVQILKAHEKIPSDRYPFYITSDCIACGTCLPECPVTAIREGELFVIDPEKCIACKKCADVCPVHACQPLTGSD